MSAAPLSGRAAELVAELGLTPHPEGGFFREVFRSERRVAAPQSAAARVAADERAAMTCIYFLLPAGGSSRWHRTAGDEAWHFLAGEPLELLCLDPGLTELHRWTLGPVAAGVEPTRIVPGGHWQAARSRGDYTLVACTVAPGFEFADFTLAGDVPSEAARLAARFPDLAGLI